MPILQESERQTYTAAEVGHILGLSKNSVYEAVRAGHIPSIRIRGKILVPKIMLDRLLSAAASDVGISQAA
ncbi:MAG: helix-turn-helix domain-containing protein [Bryobacteraceae bacterium]|nr:helix-turn-helix domain-containing protein [Bryobacteraceae bacterium]